MKKIISLMFVAVLVLSLSVTGAFANINELAQIDPEAGAETVGYYRVSENGLTEIPKSEFERIKAEQKALKKKIQAEKKAQKAKNKSTSDENAGEIGAMCWPTTVTNYDESGNISEFHRYSLKERVSQYKYNNTLDPMNWTFGANTSQSETVNFTLSSGEKSAVDAELSYDWTKSYTLDDSVTSTIRAGYTSWAEFYPIMRNSYGIMEAYTVCGYTINHHPDKWTDIYTPRYVGSQLDGVLEIKTKAGRIY
jgi:hypothetical protein